MHIFNDHSVGVLPVLEEVYSCSTQRPGFDKGARGPLLHQNKREMWIGLAAVKMMALFAKEMRLKKVAKTTPWDVEDDLVSGHIQMVHQYPTNQLALTRRR